MRTYTRISNPFISLIFGVLLLSGCISKYEFALDNELTPQLVVDGFLELERERSRIYLYESSSPVFGRSSASPTVVADSVVLIAETGEILRLQADYDRPVANAPVFYSLLSSLVDRRLEYKLHISYEGSIYESDFIPVEIATEIDSQYIDIRTEISLNEFGAEIPRPYVDFKIDFKAPTENIHYWVKYSSYQLDNCFCYIPDYYDNLVLVINDATNGLDFSNFQVNSVYATDNNFSRSYYSKITLHRLSREFFNFLEPAYIAQQNRGGLFDAIPNSPVGNVYRAEDQKPALGIFAMSYGSVSELEIDVINDAQYSYLKNHYVRTPPPLSCSRNACIQNGGSITKPY